MKTDMIEFDTQKSVQQIADVLRSFKCTMERLEDDPLAGIGGGPQPAIAVLMAGKASFGDALKTPGAGTSEWGVQVVAYDLGNRRHVELIALGESGMKQAFKAYGATGGGLFTGYGALANAYFNIRHSKNYRDQIASRLSTPAANNSASPSVQTGGTMPSQSASSQQFESTQNASAPFQQSVPFSSQQTSGTSTGYTTSATGSSSFDFKKWIIIAGVVIVAIMLITSISRQSSNSSNYDSGDEMYSEDVTDNGNESTTSESAVNENGSADPIYANASSQHDDMADISYPPENAIDRNISTAWVEGVDGEGRGEWISVTFNNEKPISALLIRNGYQKSEEAFSTNNRVKDAIVEFEDGSVERFTLKDINNAQQVVVFSEEKTGNTIRLVIQSAYLSEDEKDTCITEIGAIESGDSYPNGLSIVYAEKN